MIGSAMILLRMLSKPVIAAIAIAMKMTAMIVSFKTSRNGGCTRVFLMDQASARKSVTPLGSSFGILLMADLSLCFLSE